jgi:hypothetical protein
LLRRLSACHSRCGTPRHALLRGRGCRRR